MKFSIGIPAYKSTYLKECIDSILDQTYKDFELIIVNDASPENIDGIVNSYTDKRIRYYKNELNFGAEHVVDNWNKCLSYATGEFFTLMGDDDKMALDYFQEFSDLVERFPLCNVYHCRTLVIDENSEPITLSDPRPEFESVYDSILERMTGNRLFFISDYVYRTEVLKNNGGYYKLPLAWASDDISSYVAAMENGIAHTNNPVFMYRRNAQTISNVGSSHLKMEAILAEEIWLNSFIKSSAPNNLVENLLKRNICNELKKFIQKKKMRTIYSGSGNLFFSFFKYFLKKRKYGMSTAELIYGLLIGYKEKRKERYGA